MSKNEKVFAAKTPKEEQCPSYTEHAPERNNTQKIRLIILSPTPHPLDGGIQCQRVTFSDKTQSVWSSNLKPLSHCPSYEVLSLPKLDKPKPLHGKPYVSPRCLWLDNNYKQVSTSLYLALFELRKRTTWIQYLWIESLCALSPTEGGKLGEENLQIRAAQWQTRADIVRQARGVIICLEDTEKIQLTDPTSFGSFELVDAMLHPDEKWFKVEKADQVLGFMKYLKGGSSDVKALGNAHALWGVLTRLCHREYWNQISTIRDLHFARSIQLLLGEEIIPMDNLLKFLGLYKDTFEKRIPQRITQDAITQDVCVSDSQFWSLRAMMESKAECGPSKRHDMLSLLRLSRRSAYEDVRDRVFGLLEMASDVTESEIVIDYSICSYDIFCTVFKHIGNFPSRTPDLLALGQALHTALLGLNRPDYRFLRMIAYRQSSSSTGRFSIPGTPHGQIEFVSEDPRDLLHFVRVMERSQRSSFANFYHSTFKSDFRKAVQPWDDTIKHCSNNSGLFTLFHVENDRCIEVEKGITMFVTDKLEIGVAPKGVRKGDVLFSFQGEENASPIFAIAREAFETEKSQTSRFRIVGRAHVGTKLPSDENQRSQAGDRSSTRSSMSSKGKERIVDVEIFLPTIQALTCPLRPER